MERLVVSCCTASERARQGYSALKIGYGTALLVLCLSRTGQSRHPD